MCCVLVDLVAQQVEQFPFKEWVLGSSPSGITPDGCALVRMIIVGAAVCSCVGCALRRLVGFGDSLEGSVVRAHGIGGVGVDKIGLVAQLVEQFSLKEWVLGSSPSGTTITRVFFLRKYGDYLG